MRNPSLNPKLDARLWTRIAAAKGKRPAFQKSLCECSYEELIELAALAQYAAHAICAPEQGPFIPSLNEYLSEDSTLDFTNWVVDQGQARWLELLGADEATLAAAFEGSNNKGVAAAATIFAVASKRMGPDAYFDALERLLDADAHPIE